MAFRKGGNKLGHKTNIINNDIDKNILNAYKKSEEILNSSSSFTEKIPCLIDVWKQARLYSVEPQKNYVIHLMDWLKRHTLNIILTGDWKKYKEIYEDILINEVVHCELAFKRYNPNFSLRCKKLAEIIRDPWGNNVLHRLLNCAEISITQEELEFFAIETGYIISMRLKMLCESHCEDLALNLATTCLQCYKVAEEQNYNINATQDQKRFILDTYIALLYKFKKTSNIITILKTLPLQEGLDLVKRFSNKRISISKIWRYSKKITHLAAQVYITAAVLKPPEESLEVLKQLLTVWLSLDAFNEESLTQAVRRILQAADSAVHMYIFCELIYSKFQAKMKTFTIELFIRALTTEMNDLERQKNEENSFKVTEITNRLAAGFLRLADVLDEHLKVSRECVLTAFSLQPNESTMQRVIKSASRSGYEVLDTGQQWRCKLHPPAKESDEILWKCTMCGEDMCKFDLPPTLINTDTALSDALVAEELGLSSQLCDDLAVIIAGPRYQFLSWRLEWADLNNLCILYLNDPDRTKTLVKELKFVQIDYSMFSHIKKEPEDDELAGIERGYEMYLEDDEDGELESSEDSTSLDSRFNGLGSDGCGESPLRLFPLPLSPSKQSDPNVLKSLRMFRPTLKRTKDITEPTSSIPPKVVKSCENVTNILPDIFNDISSYECPSIISDKHPVNVIYANNQSYFNNAPITEEEKVHKLLKNCDEEDTKNNENVSSSFSVKSSENFKIYLSACHSSATSEESDEKQRLISSPLLPARKRSPSFSEVDVLKENHFLDKNRQCVDVENSDNSTKPILESDSAFKGSVTPVLNSDDSSDSSLNSCKLEQTPSLHSKNGTVEKLTNSDDHINNTSYLLSKFHLKEVKLVLDRIVLSDQYKVQDNSSISSKNNEIDIEHSNNDSSNLSGDSLNSPIKKSFKLNSKVSNLNKLDCEPVVLLDKLKDDCKYYKKVVDSNPNLIKDSESSDNTKNLKTPDKEDVNFKKKLEISEKDENTSLESNVINVIENKEDFSQNISEETNVDKNDYLFPDTLNKITQENQKPKTFGNSYENTNKTTIETTTSKKDERKINEKGLNPVELNNNKSENNLSKNDKSIPQSTMRWLINPKIASNSNQLENTYKKYAKKEYRLKEEKQPNSRYSHILKHMKEKVSALVDRSSNKENEKRTNKFKIMEDDISQIEPIFKISEISERSCNNMELKNTHKPIRNRSKSFCHEKIFPKIKTKRPNSVCGEEPYYYSLPKFQSTNNCLFGLNFKIDFPEEKEAVKSLSILDYTVNSPNNSTHDSSQSKNFQNSETNCNDFDYDDFKMEDLIKFHPRTPANINNDKMDSKTSHSDETKNVLKDIDDVMKDSFINKSPLRPKNELLARQKIENGLLSNKRKNIGNESDIQDLKKTKKQSSSDNSVNSLLMGVPGLNDLEMIRPQYTNSLVQVVQVSDPSISTAPTQISQTSTQVTPHIQRVGQPRTDKPENLNLNQPVNSSSVITSLSTATPPKSSSSDTNPTIINILQNQIRSGNTNQILRPVQVAPVLRPTGILTTHPIQRIRPPPVINILSQQVIQPATIVSCPSRNSSSNASVAGSQSEIHQVFTNNSEEINQTTTSNATRLAAASTLKTIVGGAGEQSRIVQFICKSSDGKIIPVTSLAPNKIVKVAVSQPLSSSASNDAFTNNSNLDNTLTKLIQPTSQSKSEITESPETLPKFQQAFGKSYQGNIEAVQILTATTENNNNNSNNETKIDKPLENDKVSNNSLSKSNVKTNPLPNLQHIQGSVIYSHQGVSQTINLIPPGKGQVIRIATSNPEQMSLVKDSIIHNKMSALLAAALQSRQQPQQQQTNSNNNSTEADSSSEDSLSQAPTIKITPNQRQTLVSNARIVKPIVHVSSNVIRSASNSSNAQNNLSSTTLEQLREFDMVYKQVKERSNTGGVSETTAQNENNESSSASPPQISVTYLNQNQKLNCAPVVVVSSYCSVQSAVSPALSVSSQGSSSPCVTPSPSTNFKASSKSPKSKSMKAVTTHASKASPIPKPQQKPQEDEHTAQRIFDILAEYAEQLRNSPDLNNKPAPRRRSNPPTNPSQNSKRKKSSGTKKVNVQGGSSTIISSDTEVDDSRTVGSEDSSSGVVHLALQDEENPATPTAKTESVETSTSPKQLILTEANNQTQTRNLILTDSSVGEAFKMSANTAVLMPGNYNYLMPVSMVKGGQQIRVVSSGNSKILAAVPNRSGPNMLLFQSFLNQSRKTNVSSVKYSTVQSVSGISSQTQSSVILPSTPQNLASFALGQSVTIKKDTEINNFNGEFLLAISNPRENNTIVSENSNQPEKSTILINNCKETKVIVKDDLGEMSQMDVSYNPPNVSKADPNANKIVTQTPKGVDVEKGVFRRKERIQSVLVAPGSITSPMLCQNPPNYAKHTQTQNTPVTSIKEDFVSSEKKLKDGKQGNIHSYQNKSKKSQIGDRELHQISLQRKQAALERELRLQKSLSEECEDLGVDEPSTSELFPEADIYFDSNHSPSYDQSSQDIKKNNQSQHMQPLKPEPKSSINLFEDDENSSCFRSDFLFDDPVGYQSTEMELEYDKSQGLTNGQKDTTCVRKESESEDSTLLPNCGSVTDVTIPSPVIQESCEDAHVHALPISKCKYKYSNKRKGDRIKSTENWPTDSSNVECKDKNFRHSSMQHSGEEIHEESYKLVRGMIGNEVIKDEQDDYVDICSEDEEVSACVGGSVSGRGARRSVKKLCSCCNGPQDAANTILRKRPASRPHTPPLTKKAFVNKKR